MAPAEPESSQGAPEIPSDRVGFDRPGPSPSTSHALTGAGLPRRGGGRQAQEWQPTGQVEGQLDNGQATQIAQTAPGIGERVWHRFAAEYSVNEPRRG